jgi:hypothetical protein
MKDITAVAIDTAKTTFYLLGFSATGHVVGRRKYVQSMGSDSIDSQQLF